MHAYENRIADRYQCHMHANGHYTHEEKEISPFILFFYFYYAVCVCMCCRAAVSVCCWHSFNQLTYLTSITTHVLLYAYFISFVYL